MNDSLYLLGVGRIFNSNRSSFCAKTIFGSVGDCKGPETRNTVENETIRKNLMTVLQKNSSSVTNSTVASQRIKIKADTIKCKNFTAANVLKANIRYISQVSNQMTTDVQAAYKAAIEQNIKAKTDEKPELLSLPSSAATINEFKNKLTDIVDRSITNESLQEIANKFNLEQVIEFDIGTLEGDDLCSFTNDMVLDLMATSIMSSVNNAISKDESILDLINKGDADSVLQPKGLNSLADSAFNFLKSTMGMYVILIIVVIISIVYLIRGSAGGLTGLLGVASGQQMSQQPMFVGNDQTGQPIYQ